MSTISVLIPIIPIIITSIWVIICNKKRIKDVNFNNIINVTLCGFLAVILVLPIVEILKILIPLVINILAINIKEISFILVFVINLFKAGIPEEIAKWIAIKSSKPKNPYNILINSLYISLIFMTLENYSYINKYSSISLGIYRIFMPIHIACQLIMILLLIKANEDKKVGHKMKAILFNILSVFIPVVLHALYNTYVAFANTVNVGNADIIPMVVFLGICTYIAVFIAIAKITKKYYKRENESSEIVKLNMKKLILAVVLIVISVFIFKSKN